MLRKIFLPSIFAVLAYGFWLSPDFKTVAAGVAIFLFGMLSLEEGFKTFTGGTLERLLRATTGARWKSLGFGLVTTTLMQSSSLVSVITISFLSAGLLELVQGIGIIYGANLGTTTGAWLIAGLGLRVQISAWAFPMLVFGVILLFQPRKTARGTGYVLVGLGFLFLGIHYMKEGFDAFRELFDLSRYALPGFRGLLAYTLAGILATVVMQSSHATLVLTLTALSAGQLIYENALALAIGANVGTTITAVLGAIGANVQGRRLAAAHVVFNLLTGLIAIAAIPQFRDLVDLVARELSIPAQDYTLKLAIFHTLFNLTGILVMLPLTGRLIAGLQRWLPARAPEIVRPRYLNEAALEIPDAALAALRKEVAHLFERAFGIIAHGLSLHRETILSDYDLDRLIHVPPRQGDYNIEADYERDLKTLYSEIIAFASRLRTSIPESRTEELYELRNAARGIVEAVKEVKHMRGNLVRYTVHPNRDIRMEYNRLRALLATVLRQVWRLAIERSPEVTALSLDETRVHLKDAARALDARIEQEIRDDRITPTMATSLMNDSGYAFSAAEALLRAGRALSSPPSPAAREAERELSLDEEEIERVLGKGAERKP